MLTSACVRQMTDSGRTVLVVEDDREVREVALAVIEAAGFRVLEAETGDEAYRLLRDCPDLRIDLLFTDIVMPGRLDGVDLAELCITSAARVEIGTPPADAFILPDVAGVGVRVEMASGDKCERCWRVLPEVGHGHGPADLCGRRTDVVAAL